MFSVRFKYNWVSVAIFGCCRSHDMSETLEANLTVFPLIIQTTVGQFSVKRPLIRDRNCMPKVVKCTKLFLSQFFSGC